MLGIIRLRVLDILTGWGVREAYLEIKATESDADALQAIIDKRKNTILKLACKTISNKPALSDYSIAGKKEIRQKTTLMADSSQYIEKKTGGSTGEPLIYYTSKACQGFLWASIIRSWEQTGYVLGDKIAFIAGSSVIGSGFSKNVFYKLLNIFPYSSFGMDSEIIERYIADINSQNIEYIYGYANSILLVVKYAAENNISLTLRGVICTAEQLTDRDKSFIAKVTGSIVIRQYGVNDGGVSSFECSFDNGYHVITNRSLIESVGDRIISTDLVNEAQLFIRYAVGDQGQVTHNECKCGLVYPRISSLQGRSNDMVKDAQGKVFHSEFFTHFFRDFPRVNRWQVLLQQGNLTVRVDMDAANKDEVELAVVLNDFLQKKCNFKAVNILFNDSFRYEKNGKFRYVVEVK